MIVSIDFCGHLSWFTTIIGNSSLEILERNFKLDFLVFGDSWHKNCHATFISMLLELFWRVDWACNSRWHWWCQYWHIKRANFVLFPLVVSPVDLHNINAIALSQCGRCTFRAQWSYLGWKEALMDENAKIWLNSLFLTHLDSKPIHIPGCVKNLYCASNGGSLLFVVSVFVLATNFCNFCKNHQNFEFRPVPIALRLFRPLPDGLYGYESMQPLHLWVSLVPIGVNRGFLFLCFCGCTCLDSL